MHLKTDYLFGRNFVIVALNPINYYPVLVSNYFSDVLSYFTFYSCSFPISYFYSCFNVFYFFLVEGVMSSWIIPERFTVYAHGFSYFSRIFFLLL